MKLTEKYRFQHFGHWILICLALLALLNVTVFLLYQQVWQSAVPQGADLAAENSWRMAQLGSTLGILSGFFLLAIISLAVFSAHRIGGPLISLNRSMAEVRDGNLSTRLKFREYDKMNDVETGFNEMMEALQARFEEAPSVERRAAFVAEPAEVA